MPLKYKCPWCNYEHDNLINSLRIHVQKIHKKTAKELYDALNGPVPKCSCGCCEEPKFHGLKIGYSNFCWGHHSRINNNWGHNKVSLLKSQSTRREMWKNGEIVSWSKGLTKETDDRLRISGEKQTQTYLSHPERCEILSKRMRKNRLSGVIPSLYGKDHPNWKGGISSLSWYCHKKLFQLWKRPKFKNANWKCSLCGSEEDLCVHHDKEKMADIIRKFSKEFNYQGIKETVERKLAIADAVADYHISQNISGIVLCGECHKLEHPSLNFDPSRKCQT